MLREREKIFMQLKEITMDEIIVNYKFSGVSGELSAFSQLCHKSRKRMRAYIITGAALNLRALRSTFHIRFVLYSLLAVF